MIAGMASSDYVDASVAEAVPKRNRCRHRGNGVAVVPERQVLPLLSLPEPALCRVVSCLPLRDIHALKKTCVRLNCLINDRRLECRSWFSRYSARQQADFKAIASNTDDKVLQAWVAQLTSVKKVALRLMENRKALSDFATFPETLFFATTQLMAKADAFKCTTRLRVSYCCEASRFSANGRFIMVAFRFPLIDETDVDIFDSGICGYWYRQARLPCNGILSAVVFSRDSNYLALGGLSDCAIIYHRDLAEGWRECARVDHAGDVDLTVFSPDSRHLATLSSSAAALKVLTLSEGRQWLELFSCSYARSVHAIFFSDNSRQMLVISDDEHGEIFGLNDRGMWTVQAAVHCGRWDENSPFSADGGWMVINNFGQVLPDCSATIYGQGAGGKWSESRVIHHEEPVFMVVISPSGRYLASSGLDGKVKTYVCRKEWLERNTIDHFGHRASVAFSPDERCLLSFDCHCAKISGPDQRGGWVEQAAIRFYRNREIESAAFSPDSKHVLIVGNDYTVTVASRGAENGWTDRVTIVDAQSASFSASGVHLLVVCTESRETTASAEPDRNNETRLPAYVKIYGLVGNRAWQEKAVIRLYRDLSGLRRVWARFSPDDRHVLICTSFTVRVVSIDNLPRTITLTGL